MNAHADPDRNLRRVFAAADVLLANPDGSVSMGPDDADENTFTYDEFVDGMLWLIRLGFVKPTGNVPPPPDRAAELRQAAEVFGVGGAA